MLLSLISNTNYRPVSAGLPPAYRGKYLEIALALCSFLLFSFAAFAVILDSDTEGTQACLCPVLIVLALV